ncbi:protein of unknown function [endosymbiont DhMRE of Dentiscutata heterogama]|uniref:hypothetical protein n=1 Tax=endosymbiont DhMRE of Dentiscutata heterogama TaxID=1609546 RepID=UPI000629D6FF|nr:hypothetical protein [endosymbiont DhMRE of Dentiscutata heterogama]CFW93310.1 protein of unknown function [endosymbiont DhMRE of Dentiscutata heterogama]
MVTFEKNSFLVTEEELTDLDQSYLYEGGCNVCGKSWQVGDNYVTVEFVEGVKPSEFGGGNEINVCEACASLFQND